MTLKDVKTWGYQLQNIKPKKIAASPYDLVIIDYASDDGPFTTVQVDQMKRKPDGARQLLVKAKNPAFLVISQNGDEWLPKKQFRDAIDAFAREDLFFGEDDDGKPNQPDSIKESVAQLQTFAGENKPVFVVEYPRSKKQCEQARADIAALGFIGHTAGRDLEKL